MKQWQESMLDRLASYFEADEDVLSLLLFGSLSRPESQPDEWSDIDLLLVVKDGEIGKFFQQWSGQLLSARCIHTVNQPMTFNARRAYALKTSTGSILLSPPKENWRTFTSGQGSPSLLASK